MKPQSRHRRIGKVLGKTVFEVWSGNETAPEDRRFGTSGSWTGVRNGQQNRAGGVPPVSGAGVAADDVKERRVKVRFFVGYPGFHRGKGGVVVLALLLGGLVVSAMGEIGPLRWLFGSTAVGAWLWLRRHVELIADEPDDLLDERQIHLRNGAYVYSYRFIAGCLAVWLSVVVTAHLLPEASRFATMVQSAHPVPLLGAFAITMCALPSAYLAWTQSSH